MCELFGMSSRLPTNVTFSLEKHPKKLPVIQAWARQVSAYGILNLLFSDSEYLYAHRATKLFAVTRRCPYARESLEKEGLWIHLARERDPEQRVTLIATQPLTVREDCKELPAGKVVVYRQGEQIWS